MIIKFDECLKLIENLFLLIYNMTMLLNIYYEDISLLNNENNILNNKIIDFENL